MPGRTSRARPGDLVDVRAGGTFAYSSGVGDDDDDDDDEDDGDDDDDDDDDDDVRLRGIIAEKGEKRRPDRVPRGSDRRGDGEGRGHVAQRVLPTTTEPRRASRRTTGLVGDAAVVDSVFVCGPPGHAGGDARDAARGRSRCDPPDDVLF